MWTAGESTLGLILVNEPAKGMSLHLWLEITGNSQAEKGKKMKERSRKREKERCRDRYRAKRRHKGRKCHKKMMRETEKGKREHC